VRGGVGRVYCIVEYGSDLGKLYCLGWDWTSRFDYFDMSLVWCFMSIVLLCITILLLPTFTFVCTWKVLVLGPLCDRAVARAMLE
jgi:hypothetical protein